MSLTASEMSPADIRACCGNDNNGGWGGGMWGDWILLFLLFGMWGGGYGFGGGFGGGGRCGSPCATQADVRAAVDQQTYGLADSTYALNNTITNGFHGVDNAICNLGYNIQAGINGIGHQISDCCCETQRLIERGFCETNQNISNQLCETRYQAERNTRDIIDNQNCNTRAILDFLTQDKIATLTAENQTLRFQASQAAQNAFITANQEAQTAELIRRLGRDCPVPAYVVPNPNCCYGNPVGVSFGGSGCGCG